MGTYNSESALARLLGPLYARSADEGRALLREAFRDAGDLRRADDRLEVCLNPLSAPAPWPLSASSSTTPRPPIPGPRW